MSFFKKRKCEKCNILYTPTSTTQQYCKKCGLKNKKEKNLARVKKFMLKKKKIQNKN